MNSSASYHGFVLRYGCDGSALERELRETFLELEIDQETREFIDAAATSRHGRAVSILHSVLRPFLSDFDINGLLGTYPLFLLSTAQWAQLLKPSARARLLDVGAASGEVTARLATLFHEVRATETSRPMARRLRRRGIACETVDIAVDPIAGGPYDVLTCLNVIDRCNRPTSLLESAYRALNLGGYLVVAAPLPLEPFVYAGGATRAPVEKICAAGPTWEASAGRLWRNVLAPLGAGRAKLIRWCRAPYLSVGDRHSALYVLDDAIFVIEKL